MMGTTGIGGDSTGGSCFRVSRMSLRIMTMVTPVEPMFFCAPACVCVYD